MLHLTAGNIWDWEIMLFGKLFWRLSVVTSAHVTWNPVIGWWRFTLESFHEKCPVMFPSSTLNEADRFSGLANTFETTCPVKKKKCLWIQVFSKTFPFILSAKLCIVTFRKQEKNDPVIPAVKCKVFVENVKAVIQYH